MSLDRPAPQRRTRLDAKVRKVIVRAAIEGLELGRKRVVEVTEAGIWRAYTSAQLLPSQLDVGLEEVGSRYGIAGLDRELHRRLREHVEATETMGLAPYPSMASEQMARAAYAIGASTALELLPDQEFLTALQDAATAVARQGPLGQARSSHILETLQRAFRLYGLPYEVAADEIRWVGDEITREQVIDPALAALEEPRLSGAASEFRQAQAGLRGGTADNLRDATHEAGNAVEAALLALMGDRGVSAPRSRAAAALFNALREAQILPAALEQTVLAAPLLRNAQGGHPQGATATAADRRLAESAVSSAAVAITALAGYLS